MTIRELARLKTYCAHHCPDPEAQFLMAARAESKVQEGLRYSQEAEKWLAPCICGDKLQSIMVRLRFSLKTGWFRKADHDGAAQAYTKAGTELVMHLETRIKHLRIVRPRQTRDRLCQCCVLQGMLSGMLSRLNKPKLHF